MQKIISGIQQVGIGVANCKEAFKWYKLVFGTNIQIFDEEATAALMLPYTGGKPRDRRAILAMNLQGGGGLEIWQYTSRSPQKAVKELLLGDLGINIAKIKSKDIQKTYDEMAKIGVEMISKPTLSPNSIQHFFIKDPYGNIFEIVESDAWLFDEKKSTGSIFGVIIGVSNIDNSLRLYRDILGYDEVIFDKSGYFDDLSNLPGGNEQFRRVLLRHKVTRKGAFSELLGPSQIELIECIDRKGERIFENRFWGDLGFIHLCFDVSRIELLEEECLHQGFPFTVNSASGGDTFDMGEAAGQFAYIEDPDGCLIEFVETHKIPIIKKLGWYLNLRKRNPEKSLPKWMLGAMRLGNKK